MAKINLITIHWGESYGAIAQTYASLKILRSLGHEVTLINLVDEKFNARYKKISTFFSLIKIIRFWMFKAKYFKPMTKLMFKIDKSKIPSADYTIVGSDQVWNRDITQSLSMSYFLDFVPDNCKRLSLSSSFSKSFWSESDEYTNKVRDELNKFIAISVREKSGIDICKENFNVNAIQLLDPTLMLNDYSEIIGNRNSTRNEIVLFRFIYSDLFNQVADFMSKKIEMPYKHLAHATIYEFNKRRCSNSPSLWMKNIASSSFVITDSFHGVVFAIIFKKRFVALKAIEDRFERIESLLNLLSLSERIILSFDYLQENYDNLIKPIDYEKVEEILKSKRDDYFSFLKEYIN
jgi:hypothetical protein